MASLPDPDEIGLWAQLACVWEATARKAGNVHPGQDFADVTYLDFVISAAAIAPVFARAPRQRVGTIVLEAIQATRRLVASNTNLGIVLLLAPLAAVPRGEDLQQGVERVLAGLDVEDSRRVYAAIRLAQAGGIGAVAAQDVNAEPTLPLRAIMTLAHERDLVARQYANGFREVFEVGVPALHVGLQRFQRLEPAIVYTHLLLLSRHPDSLIARKRGAAEAAEASRRAAQVLSAGGPGSAAFAELDAWLRAEGHARNPGTSADLVAACLFAALRTGTISNQNAL